MGESIDVPENFEDSRAILKGYIDDADAVALVTIAPTDEMIENGTVKTNVAFVSNHDWPPWVQKALARRAYTATARQLYEVAGFWGALRSLLHVWWRS